MFNEYISAPVRASASVVGEPVRMIEELPQPFGVSTKTVRHLPGNFNRAQGDAKNSPVRRRSPANRDKAGDLPAVSPRRVRTALARWFNQPQPRIERIIDERCAARIRELPLDSMGNEDFARLPSREEEAEILGPAPESDVVQKKPHVPGGLPAYFASLYGVPLLTREQEAHLFRKMNYLKYKAGRLRDELDWTGPRAA